MALPFRRRAAPRPAASRVVVPAPLPSGLVASLRPPARPCVLGDCGGLDGEEVVVGGLAGLSGFDALGDAATAAAKRRAQGRPAGGRPPLGPDGRPQLAPGGGKPPLGPDGRPLRAPAGGGKPPLTDRVKKLPADQVEKLAGKKEAEYDRKHRADKATLDKLDRVIESGKLQGDKLAQAKKARRKVAAREVGLYHRRLRARLAKQLMAASKKAKGADADKYRKAATWVMSAPIKVNPDGSCTVGCPSGSGSGGTTRTGSRGTSGLAGALGLPGGAYTGDEAVQQFSLHPAQWASPDAGLRAAITAAGAGAKLADRPAGVSIPQEIRHELPPGVIAAQPQLPALQMRTRTMPPAVVRVAGIPAPIPPCVRPSIPAAAVHPGHAPGVLPPPSPASSGGVTAAGLSGLGADLVLADVLGDYDTTVGLAESGYLGLEDVFALSGLSDVEFRGLGLDLSKIPFIARLRAHKTKTGKRVSAGLLGGALAAAGFPLAGTAVAAKGPLSDLWQKVAQGHADEEEEVAKTARIPVKSGAKSKRVLSLRTGLQRDAAAFRCPTS